MNPIIKFTTLFGLLAVEMAVEMATAGPQARARRPSSSLLSMVFVYRSFYGMRIPVDPTGHAKA